MDGAMWQGVFGLVSTAMWIGLIVFVFVSLRRPLIELLLPRVSEVNAFGVGIAFDRAEELLAKAAESALAEQPYTPGGTGGPGPGPGELPWAGSGDRGDEDPAAPYGTGYPAHDGAVPHARPEPPADPAVPVHAGYPAPDGGHRQGEGPDTGPDGLPSLPEPPRQNGAPDVPWTPPAADPRRGAARPSLYGQRSAAARLESSAAVLRGGRILWVDGHPERNRHLMRLFQEVGMAVIPVVSAAEAVAELSAFRCDLVISDDERAGGPHAGPAMLGEFAAMGFDIPVIIYTARVRPDGARSPLVYGATDSAADVVNYVIDLMERLRFDRIAPSRPPRSRGWIRRG